MAKAKFVFLRQSKVYLVFYSLYIFYLYLIFSLSYFIFSLQILFIIFIHKILFSLKFFFILITFVKFFKSLLAYLTNIFFIDFQVVILIELYFFKQLFVNSAIFFIVKVIPPFYVFEEHSAEDSTTKPLDLKKF